MLCRSKNYLGESCETCELSPNCDNCIYCLEIEKEVHRRIKKRAIDRVSAILDGKRFQFLFTISPGDIPYDDFVQIMSNLKERKWLMSCKVAYELTKEGYPHCHGIMETTRKIQWSELRHIANMGTTQLKVYKGLSKVKWTQYMEKKKTQKEINYFFHRDEGEEKLCGISLIDQLK